MSSMSPEQFKPTGLEASGRAYVVNSYCKQRQEQPLARAANGPLILDSLRQVFGKEYLTATNRLSLSCRYLVGVRGLM